MAGLSNVDDTSDANKPVLVAAQNRFRFESAIKLTQLHRNSNRSKLAMLDCQM
jgi:hypothetical protein